MAGAGVVTDRPLTISDVAQNVDFAVRVVGGSNGLDRPVNSAHVLQWAEDLPFVRGGTLVLTTDRPHLPSHRRGEQFMTSLADAKMAGLGVGVYHDEDQLPPEMVAAADSLCFPLLRIGPTTSLQAIVAYVLQAVVFREMHSLKRAMSAHDSLLNLVLEGGVQGMLWKAADIIDADIFVYGLRGEVRQACCRGRDAEAASRAAGSAWRAWAAGHFAASDFGLAASECTALDIFRCGRRDAVLIAAKRPGVPLADAERQLLTFVGRILEVESGARTETSSARRRAQAKLVKELVHGSIGPESALQLADWGFPESGPLRVVLVRVTSSQTMTRVAAHAMERCHNLTTATLEALENSTVLRGLPSLVAAIDGLVAVVLSESEVSGSTELRDLVVRLSDELRQAIREANILLGVSERLDNAAHVHFGATHAHQAILAERQGSGTHAAIVWSEELSVEQRVLDYVPDGVLAELKSRYIDRLYEDDPEDADALVTVLSTYLRTNGSVSHTSDALYLHRNTLRRRLEKLEVVLGVDLQSISDLTALRFALAAADHLQTRQSFPRVKRT